MQASSPVAIDFVRALTPRTILDLASRRMQEIAARKRRSIPAPDPAQWIADAVTIEDPQGERVSIIPFDLWPAQRESLDTILNHNQVIILKARQLGLSWLWNAYAVWLCLHHDNQSVLVFSKDQDSAQEMVRRCRGIYTRLRDKPAALVMDNTRTLAWDNGSRIKSFAATEDAGASYTASLTILEEFARMQFAEALYTSVKPTIDDGGRMVVVSNGRGEGNPFHRLWQGAVAGSNSFKPVFLPWHARPGRDADWYARVEAAAISSAHHRQEYPNTPEEAFTTVGEERFIDSPLWWDACREDLPPLARNDTLVLAADAGIASDTFGIVGVSAHPARSGVLAVRVARAWTPPRGGQLDFYAPDGPDEFVRRLCAEYNVAQLEYDPWQLHSFALKLGNDGIVFCHEFNQQGRRLEADKALYDFILARRLAHDGHPDLREHILNANRKVESDPDSAERKLRLVKRSAALKIDLAVSLSMAAHGATTLGFV